MSIDFKKALDANPELTVKEWCKRPGRFDEDGIIYTTEQSHKEMCDINNIIAKYNRTGLITHVSKIEGYMGDMTGNDFHEMQNKIAKAVSMFNDLPSEIRKRFKNNPENLLQFMEDPNNREEGIELGLINKRWTKETDGFGEHVKEGENIEEPEKVNPE